MAGSPCWVRVGVWWPQGIHGSWSTESLKRTKQKLPQLFWLSFIGHVAPIVRQEPLGPVKIQEKGADPFLCEGRGQRLWRHVFKLLLPTLWPQRLTFLSHAKFTYLFPHLKSLICFASGSQSRSRTTSCKPDPETEEATIWWRYCTLPGEGSRCNYLGQRCMSTKDCTAHYDGHQPHITIKFKLKKNKRNWKFNSSIGLANFF